MDKINVLLVSGVVAVEHYYPDDNERFRRVLESTGMFNVKITEEFNGATKATVDKYDVIILNYDGKNVPGENGYEYDYIRWTPETEKLLFDFVKSGKGLMLHHTSLWLEDNLPEDYKKIWGAYLQINKGSRKSPSDEFTVRMTEGSSFTKNLPNEWRVINDDLFVGVVLDPDSNIEVVATAYDSLDNYIKDKNWPPARFKTALIPGGKLENMVGVNTFQPIAWTNTFGKGRVFAMTIGHDLETWRRVSYLTLLCRGVEWAATGYITIEPPDRSEENRFKKWPYFGQ